MYYGKVCNCITHVVHIIAIYFNAHTTLLLLCIDEDPCDNHTCPTGSQCEVYKGKAYCMPSCDLDNGGCPTDEKCSLQFPRCLNPPCPPEVKCSPGKQLRGYIDKIISCIHYLYINTYIAMCFR